jgi:hypothetical protein
LIHDEYWGVNAIRKIANDMHHPRGLVSVQQIHDDSTFSVINIRI